MICETCRHWGTGKVRAVCGIKARHTFYNDGCAAHSPKRCPACGSGAVLTTSQGWQMCNYCLHLWK
jgi:hypothetical protein